jgi:hypothetical protein
VTALSCVFCGSSNVLKQDANRNAIRPESLVPMDVGRRDVERAFHRWLKGLWFRPNALRKTRDFDAVGVYLPFWTFDCAVHSDWSAQSGTYYYVTVTKTRTVNGKTQTYTTQERRTRWRPAWGQRDDGYDDLLVNASHAVSESLVRELGGFDTRGLVPYRPEYLAGWRAEEYRRDLEQGWEDGERAVVESQRARCAGDVPGDTSPPSGTSPPTSIPGTLIPTTSATSRSTASRTARRWRKRCSRRWAARAASWRWAASSPTCRRSSARTASTRRWPRTRT